MNRVYFAYRNHGNECFVLKKPSDLTPIYRGKFDSGEINEEDGKWIVKRKIHKNFFSDNFLWDFSIIPIQGDKPLDFSFRPYYGFWFPRMRYSDHENVYDVYRHFGYKISVCTNDIKIAQIDKFHGETKLGLNKVYEIQYHNSESLLAIGIIFSICSRRDMEAGREITFDINPFDLLFCRKVRSAAVGSLIK